MLEMIRASEYQDEVEVERRRAAQVRQTGRRTLKPETQGTEAN